MDSFVRFHYMLVGTQRYRISNFLEQHNRCKISLFRIYFYQFLNSWVLGQKCFLLKGMSHDATWVYPGHLQGCNMFLRSHLYEIMHPLTLGILPSSSHVFWVLFDEVDICDSLFPRTYWDLKCIRCITMQNPSNCQMNPKRTFDHQSFWQKLSIK